MTSKDKAKTIDELIEKVRAYETDEKELDKIRKAYLFAEEQHSTQMRKSGEAYITHPLNVAMILTSVSADSDTIQAALLHDVLEDCDCTKEEMTLEFGEDVTRLVSGVTKLSKINFSTENEYLTSYYKKIIVGISEDVRVIIIKLADTLHNMRTLWVFDLDKQKTKAKTALEIFAPIASHLGMHKIKSELEDLSLRYLKADVFHDIAEKLSKTKLERDKTVYEMRQDVSNILNEHDITHSIKGRAKSIYSIYNKLDKGKKFSDIYDLLALRILVDTEQECYLALGIIHSKFRPLPKRFKDYVAMPKSNMYQSLHTTVFGLDGYLFEIQIRTYEMDEIAENGIASHWAYKENKDAKANMQNTTEQKLQFFKSIMDLDNFNMNSEDFVNSVKDEILNNNIYVFTPKGDIVELPRESTPLDFAYKIHTRVGETTVGAIVNNSIVPLNYQLQNNDIIKINTNKSSTPSQEWINMVKTTQARNRIKSYFTKSEREIYIERGKNSLEKELRKRKLGISGFLNDENLKKIYDQLKIDSMEELYLVIGNGKTPPNSVINIILKEDSEPEIKKIKIPIKSIDKDVDIIVSGIDNVRVALANCCSPVFGDDIIGYITKGKGITVHKTNCHNLSTLEIRTVPVEWNKTTTKRYLCNLLAYSNTRDNHMADIVQKISMQDVSVDSIGNIHKTDTITYQLSVYVKGLENLNKLMLELEKLPYIHTVERLMR